MYRFKDDPEWGQILKRFRQGVPLPSDFHRINQRVIGFDGRTKDGDEIPHDISYATPRNKERDAINAGVFSKVIQRNPEQAIIIFSDGLGVKKGSSKSLKYTPVMTTVLWQECGESDLKFKGRTTRMDPVLKLYKGCPVMLTDNFDVDNRMANGTQGILEKVVLKAGQQTSNLKVNGIEVKAVFASQVKHVLVQHAGKDGDSFKMEPKKFTGFRASMPRPVDLITSNKKGFPVTFTANQIPVVVNCATTGHKLQGCTRSSIFVNCFSYDKNWPYVVLSRVKTRKGLYLRQKLDESKDYSVDMKLFRMLQIFAECKQVPDDYFVSDE
jgi:hypothetical protein